MGDHFTLKRMEISAESVGFAGLAEFDECMVDVNCPLVFVHVSEHENEYVRGYLPKQQSTPP
jgi:hypothetical protein